MNLRSASFLIAAGLLAGCGLVYNYGDYKDQAPGGMSTSTGTAGATSTSSSTSSGTTSTSSSTSSLSSSGSSSTSSGCAGSGETCVALPTGWTGPVTLVESDKGAPACPMGSDPLLDGGTSLTDGGCSACSCSGPLNGTCNTPVSVNGYGTNNCDGGATPVSLTEACLHETLYVAFKGATIDVTDATCDVTKAAHPLPVTWSSSAITCKAAPPTCTGGGICVTQGSPLCVYLEGGVSACPPGFPAETLVYTQTSDTRVCAACSCAATGRTCNATLTVYTDSSCSDSAASGALDSCVVSAATPGSVSLSGLTPTGGSCQVSGGALFGAVTPSGLYTVCCTN